MDWKDQMTRSWWQELATFHVMTLSSRNCHDNIPVWGLPPLPSWCWSATTGYLLLAAYLLCLVTYGVWLKLQQHLLSDNAPICPSVCSTGNLTTAYQVWQWKSAHWHWPSAIGWLGMWMMIAKALMRGLWEACRCCCCVLFTLYVSRLFHFRFTLISFHTARHIEAFDVHWCLLCRHGFVMRSPGSWLGGSRVSALRLFWLAPLGHPLNVRLWAVASRMTC